MANIYFYMQLNSKTHLPKATLSEAVAELIEEAPENGEEIRASRSAGIPSDAYYPKTDDNPYSKFETVEFDDSLAALWKTLRTN